MEEYLASIFFWWRDLSRDFLGALLETLGIFFGLIFGFHSITPLTWNPEHYPGLGPVSGFESWQVWSFFQGLFRNCVSCIFNSDDHL